MTAKKRTSNTPDPGLQTLKIGSRVRCTDDRVEGRIVWANGVSVKITWNDGEQVTWRRDSLADRPIEILGSEEDQATAPVTTAEQTEPSQAEQETEPQAPDAAPAEPNAPTPEPEAATAAPTGAAEPTEASAESEAATAPPPASEPAAAPTAASAPEQTVAKNKRQWKALAETQEKKLSALDAAAKVLAETHTPMNCQELIDAMAAKGYWTSPGGKTPAATLYSAMLREIAVKGAQARFTKTGRGHFAYQGA
jgi:HB1, ASXL, restriction endonuclease HTH domain